MIIGVAGGICGLIVGYILSLIISYIPFETPSLPTIKTYPVYFGPMFYFIGITFALFTTYIAGLFPARRASEVDPVTIIEGNSMVENVLDVASVNKYFYDASRYK